VHDLRRFAVASLLLGAVGVAAAAGFHLILDEEGWLHSVYRAFLTVTLTGVDTHPGGAAAQLFTMAVAAASMGIFFYVAGALVELIAGGVIEGRWAERRRRRIIESLRDHYIICGFGRVGRRVAAEFAEAGVQYVVLDFSETAIREAREHGVPFIEGNGTEDEDLLAAGLERARGLVASSDDDSDNLYIALSARTARPDLLIVARASDDDAAKKLRLAGADRVVQPFSAAGREMATLVLKPQVAAFIDVATGGSGDDLRFEEIEVTTGSGQAGNSIRDLNIRGRTGAMIVALRKGDGTFDTTPVPDAQFDVGDVMIAAGTPDELRKLEDLFARDRVGE
jgi:voltage-gated potassium channel